MDPEYKSQHGIVNIATSSSLNGVMQNSSVFCDFDISYQNNAIHEINDILIEMNISNNAAVPLYLTSTYLFYDMIQIFSDDKAIEEIRSDNSFVDHNLVNFDFLTNLAFLEKYEVLSLGQNIFRPRNIIAANSSERMYIVLPPCCITNKDIPLTILKSKLKIRIYFKTITSVNTKYDGVSGVAYNPVSYSNNFSVNSMDAILIGRKFDENTLQLKNNKYLNKTSIINTHVHNWRNININKDIKTEQTEVKVSLNGKMSDVSFFIRPDNTNGTLAGNPGYHSSQYTADLTGPTSTNYQPSSLFTISNLTLKDSNGDYSGYYSSVSSEILRIVNNKYENEASSWDPVYQIYKFNFSDNIHDSIKTGFDYGNCLFDGNFNLIFNLKNDLSIPAYTFIDKISLIVVSHQQVNLILDNNGKLYKA